MFGVLVRAVEKVARASWERRVVDEVKQKICAQIEAWRYKAIDGGHAYVFLDPVYLKRSWGGEARNVPVLVAIGVDTEGFREVLRVGEGAEQN